MKEKKTKKNKRRSVSEEIEELEERLKETGIWESRQSLVHKQQRTSKQKQVAG